MNAPPPQLAKYKNSMKGLKESSMSNAIAYFIIKVPVLAK